MKKKVMLIFAVIAVVLLVIFIKNKIRLSKVNYDIAEVKAYNYVKYIQDDKLGVINRAGDIIIEAKYKYIDIPNPEKDLFICYDEMDGKKTVLNSKNEQLFTQYESVEAIELKNVASFLCFEKSVLKYKKDGLYGLINFEGKEIAKNKYSSIENLQSTEGKLLVSKDGKFGVINIKGTKIIDTKYDQIQSDEYYSDENKDLNAGFIVSNKTEEGYRYGYINYSGKEILRVKYGEIARISDKKEPLLIVKENGKFGLYKNSKELIKPEYQSIIYNDNDCLTIQKNREYGIADLTGNIRVEPKYTMIEVKGMYIYAEKDNKRKVFDVKGNISDINFNKVVYKTENDEYRITTLLNNDITYYGVENKNGVALINSSYRYLEYLFKDYFIAKNENGKLGIINANGKVMVDFKYDLVQKIKGKNIVQLLSDKSKETEIYSKDLKLVATLKDAVIDNENNYIKVYNKKEIIYLNENGEKVNEDSEIIKNSEVVTLPNKIGDYEKEQYSLNNVYYIKK